MNKSVRANLMLAQLKYAAKLIMKVLEVIV